MTLKKRDITMISKQLALCYKKHMDEARAGQSTRGNQRQGDGPSDSQPGMSARPRQPIVRTTDIKGNIASDTRSGTVQTTTTMRGIPSDSQSGRVEPPNNNFELPSMIFDGQHIFVNGSRVKPEDLPEYLGTDAHENQIRVDEAISLETILEEGTFIINYPFRAHNCAACWKVFMDPKALVVHLEKAHAEDFILFRCSICERKFGTLRGIAIHYGKCLRKEPTPPAVENGTNGDNLKHSCTECRRSSKPKSALVSTFA